MHRYAVPGATGKEVIIFDLYPGTGEKRSRNSSELDVSDLENLQATNILAKDIFSTTETGARVAVMCNSTTVSFYRPWRGYEVNFSLSRCQAM